MSEALKLANLLYTVALHTGDGDTSDLPERAADELRRLVKLNTQLLEALRGMTEIAELTIGWLPTPPDADGPLIHARAAISAATDGSAV